MLSELYIENLAVIRETSVNFCKNLNIFTGETGAGKSILINGINAILGQRITRDFVRTGEEKAFISATFTDIPENAVKKLEELGFSCPDRTVILSREISSDGGSVARINQRPATVSAMHDVGGLLINIHGQHDSQVLLSPERHLGIIDSFGELDGMISEYRESFRQLQEISRNLKSIMLDEAKKSERIEKLSEIVDEIGSLDLEDGEDIAIEEEFQLAKNSDLILKALNLSNEALNSETEVSALDLIGQASEQLSRFADVSADIDALCKRLSSAVIELSDISDELSKIGDGIDINGERYDYLTKRRDTINRLKKKYGPELSDVIKTYENSAEELVALSSSDEEIKRLEGEKNRLLSEVTAKAKALSEARTKAGERFVSEVGKELAFLDMPNVKLAVSHETGKLTANGMDTLELLISSNPGEPPKPIAKIASGGELSRIMLALKCVIADKDDIPTMIFDEIDAGVSGRAAQKIGIKLAQIGKLRQVLCVTHLAQIAVMADNHLVIEKKVSDGRTITTVKPLDFEGRKLEIARIMGGDNITELMLENAEELLKTKNNT